MLGKTAGAEINVSSMEWVEQAWIWPQGDPCFLNEPQKGWGPREHFPDSPAPSASSSPGLVLPQVRAPRQWVEVALNGEELLSRGEAHTVPADPRISAPPVLVGRAGNGHSGPRKEGRLTPPLASSCPLCAGLVSPGPH